MSRCCLVYPTTVQIGTVKWDGKPAREPLLMVERVHCPRDATVSYTANGERYDWCHEHALERIPKDCS